MDTSKEVIARQSVAALVASQTVASQAVAQQPVGDRPFANQPFTDQPLADQPVPSQPFAVQPFANQPAAIDARRSPRKPRSSRKSYRTPYAPSGAASNVVSIASDLLPLSDFLLLLLVASVSSVLYSHWLPPQGLSAGGLPAALLPAGLGHEFAQALLVAAVLAPFILYDRRFGTLASRGEVAHLLRSYGSRFALFAAVVWLLGELSDVLNDFPRAWLLLWFAASLLATSLTRVLVASYLRRLQRRGVLTEVIAVVGAGVVADRLVQALRESRPHSIELLGIFDDRAHQTDNGAAKPDTANTGTAKSNRTNRADPADKTRRSVRAEPGRLKPDGTLAHLIELARTRHIDWVLLTLPAAAEQRVQTHVQRLKALSVPIGLCPQHVGLTLPDHRIGYVADNLPVSLLADRPIQRWDAVVKGGEDFVLGAFVTLLLLPVLGIIALAIKLNSPGPIIFKQRRHAMNNDEFDIYKFRTMRWSPAAASKEMQQTLRNDDRITRVGRFLRATSLDELPQLFNVLRGEMSLVGPRPHAVNMRTENRLGHEITDLYAHRHRVKPGITGWSQVNGARGATATTAQLQRRVELDLQYIEGWSLLLDLKILLLTCREVVKRTNAF